MTPTLDRLTPEQDAQLRRLHFFELMGGTLSPEMRSLKAELRARDRRIEIRLPEEGQILAFA